MKEIWKDIEGYEGLYQISNLGRVKSLDRECKHSLGGNRKVSRRILKAEINKQGYLRIGLSYIGKRKKIFVHKLVAEAFIPNPENKPQVNHKNGIKSDNRVSNLEWSTRSENLHHAYNTGLINKEEQAKISIKNLQKAQKISKQFWGEKIHSAKLTEKDIIEIRHIFDTKQMNNKELAKKYNITVQHMRKITSRKSWTRLL